jgi:hypothetical protein
MMQQQKKQAGVSVFYSYAPDDKQWRDRLSVHFSQLRRDNLIREWHDQQILAGANRAQEIDQAIRSADIILLLISADFLASDALYLAEMQQALKRHDRGEARVVPIIVRPCDWQHSPFARLQYLPRNGRPIATWENKDEAFLTLVQELRQIITQQLLSGSLDQQADLDSTRITDEDRSGGIVGAGLSPAPTIPPDLSYPQELAPPGDEPWQGGMTIDIQGTTYLLYEPVEPPVRHADGSFLRRQAKAQRLRDERLVWLKQVRVLRANTTSNLQRVALEKEYRLLTKLEQEQNFPHVFEPQSDRASYTLIHSLPQRSETLRDVFGPSSRNEPLTDPILVRTLLRSMSSLCNMLAVLHRERCFHRMLTPEGILIVGSSARLRDMGLATFPRLPGEGPPLYQAPEQERLQMGKQTLPGAPTDIYQLAAILYHILTGQAPSLPPWGGIMPVLSRNPDLPAALDDVLLRSLQPLVRDRYQRIQDFSRDLRKVVASL